MPAKIFRLLLVIVGSLLLMIGVLVGSLWLTYHGQASRLTNVLNVLGYGVIPFLVGVLVSWQLRDIPRAIAITLWIGLMGAFWANAWGLSFGLATEDDLGTVFVEIGIILTIPYLLLGSLASLCGLGVARLLGPSPGQHTADVPE